MKAEKKVIAIVPARGGSKSIKNKNLSIFNGQPLIKWTLDIAKKSKCFSKIIVSSDDANILDYCKQQNVITHLRDKSIAQDSTPMEKVIFDVLTTEGYVENNEYFMLLQPTSPLRTKKHISNCIDRVHSEKIDSIVSITNEDNSSLKWLMASENDFKPIISYEYLTKNRQELPRVYRPNGSIYTKRIDSFLKTKKLIDCNTKFFNMEKHYSVDIDTPNDLKMAEQIIKDKK